MKENSPGQYLERLLEISQNLSAGPELEPFLQSVCAAASDLVGWKSSSILFFDENYRALRFAAGPWSISEPSRTFKISIEKSLAGWVYKHAQAAIVQDACQDPRVYHPLKDEPDFETGSIVAFPLLYNGEPNGVLEAVSDQAGDLCSPEDIQVLQILAAQAAVALQNALVLEKARDAYEQIVELDQMKSDFIAITSHELRTPLGLILGHATFIREFVSNEQGEEMDVVIRSALRLKEIIEEFSNVENFKSGMARLRLRQVDVPRFVQEIVDSFEETARQKNINMKTDLAKITLSMELDPEKIGMALNNLIKNALTFTNPGGHVLIRADRIRSGVRISVSDNGIGVPARDIKKLFERFYQVESHLTRRHGGLGLGLSIARDMIELHGGRIWAESVEGHGSRISFTLPVKESTAS